MKNRTIEIIGAATNTLKRVSCSIPHAAFTVITGPSGSGKSSLAFDTLYAEGQRRYMESMSAYARQFMERIERPDVEEIRHILPAIALDQKNHVKNARSTVGTATEIDDYLRLLYYHLGQTVCDDCGGGVTQSNPRAVAQQLQTLPEKTKLLILAPVSLSAFSKPELLRRGFFRAYVNHEIRELDEVGPEHADGGVLPVVVDRLMTGQGKNSLNRLHEALQSALSLADGTCRVVQLPGNIQQTFQSAFACQGCGKVYEKPSLHHFSFNSPLGACTACEGFGRIIGLDLDKVIPNKDLSLADGAIHPFTMPSNHELQAKLLAAARKKKIPINQPYRSLTDAQKAFVLEGGPGYPGVHEFFEWLESKKYKVHVRVMLAKYRGYYPCPNCLGSRLRPEALRVRIGDYSLWDLQNLPVSGLLEACNGFDLSESEQHTADRLLREITNRLRCLDDMGLGYLTLSRQSRTLSGGESQRINLSAALGNLLTDTLYVLDEPTVGLHARDTHRLLSVLRRLRDQGNTVAVVEHDPDVIRAADHLIDMGPGGGEDGGRILYEGPVSGLADIPYSLTAQWLSNLSQPAVAFKPAGRQKKLALSGKKAANAITIVGARGHNLKNLTVSLPKNQLVCVSGVSGSGKSTLIKQTLYLGYQHAKGNLLQMDAVPYDELRGLDGFADVILVDQSPPGRSQRSNPATYLKAYDEIRKVFAATRKATVLGLTPGDFSFNTPGGRCETCEGMGTLTIDMQFMADVTVVCHDCRGRRFNSNVLSVDIEGNTITDILHMTVDEAVTFFNEARVPRVANKLEPFQRIGLGYLALGQSTSTLSGGEAQRMKLASYIGSNRKETNPCLFLFDEPTTGLHMADIHRLVQVFRGLLEAGHSLIVVEHNLEFIAQADYLLDLGPEGGDGGGYVVAAGTVADVMACPQSHTGTYLCRQQGTPVKTA